MSQDPVELECLRDLFLAHATCHVGLVEKHQQTCTGQALALVSTRRFLLEWQTRLTSSINKPFNSALQSSMRSRSVASTTQMSASVFSK